MAVNTKGNISRIKSMVMEYTCGLMDASMKDTGETASKMVRANILWKMGLTKLESGKMERGCSGLKANERTAELQLIILMFEVFYILLY
jgi:hypothetical protein